ncbi:ATP-dependent helicase [Campylobacter estrildidarum]|uniref:DNA 3'-5' helicase n=1 Tax=Campylobacter estrildidarum TaxID=2510189 RepID=A0A4U7BN13_9BACT|nr:UvrD-helicase domain-containing protein [Campylobacter estrildidarum]TKX32041.1 ATP-dependent DNA helicase [Campylobacter estrildidarum]
MNLFKDLNPSQKEAASHIDGAMLILAGAGSGKTKTITTRLAYLIKEVGISPSNTLTLTFTNKAASVMKSRALSLINSNANPLLCTFHKFGLMFLRMHIEKLNRKNDFIVIDSDDAKKILKEMVDDSKENISTILHFISTCKNMAKNPDEILKDLKTIENSNKIYAKYYQKYQDYLVKYNFVDFDDLLLLSYQILENDLEFAKTQSNIYQYITVDEYQDTNTLQYKILKKLCSSHENICVVGDDDQSIYGWRGAKIENILNFQSQFNNVKLVKLEQNYRSVGSILNAANILIEHNKKRLGKTLVCTKDHGEEIKLLYSDDEKKESNSICKKIKELLSNNTPANEIAILFRVNALSRAIEEAFMREKIAYKLLSGMRFYERLEIKDLIAYLRFLAHTNDDFSLKRIINRPKRSIGESSVKKFEEYAKKEKISLFEALCNPNIISSKKTNREIQKFIHIIHELLECKNLKQLIGQFEEKIKLKDFYKEQIDAEDRVANICEFYANLNDKIKQDEDLKLNDFLNEISLLGDQDNLDGNCVYIMSIHASKGLEFDHVFIIGLEEGFFPVDNSDIEEERRLAYVAITRAKKQLHLSVSNSRFYRGSRTKLFPSRFLEESKLSQNKSPYFISQKNTSNYQKGDLVKHKIFGIGRITGVIKNGKEERLKINFGGIERTILSSFVEGVV